MNQTGVASTGWRRQALMNRVPGWVRVHLEERPREADQILQPHRLEPQLGAEFAELARDAVIEEVVARYNRHRRPALSVKGAKPSQEPQAIDQRHPQVENDGVRVAAFGMGQADFGGGCRL